MTLKKKEHMHWNLYSAIIGGGEAGGKKSKMADECIAMDLQCILTIFAITASHYIYVNELKAPVISFNNFPYQGKLIMWILCQFCFCCNSLKDVHVWYRVNFSHLICSRVRNTNITWVGWSLFSDVYLPHFRIPGVLQRFAGTYLVVATIHMFFAKTADTNMVSL